jgi:hypothetical protein
MKITGIREMLPTGRRTIHTHRPTPQSGPTQHMGVEEVRRSLLGRSQLGPVSSNGRSGGAGSRFRAGDSRCQLLVMKGRNCMAVTLSLDLPVDYQEMEPRRFVRVLSKTNT